MLHAQLSISNAMNYFSRFYAQTINITIVLFFIKKSLFFVNSGLLVGLVGRPTCQTEIPETPDPTTTKPPTTTTTVGVITGEPMTTAIQETTHGSDATTAPSVRSLQSVNASGGRKVEKLR